MDLVDSGPWLMEGGLPLVALSCVAVSYFIVRKCVTPMVTRYKYDSIREKKKSSIRLLKESWYHVVTQQISAEDCKQITARSLESLLEDLHSGKIDPLKTLQAFQRHAAEIDHKLNFVAEPIKEAEGWARELATLSEVDRRKKPLFGIPISIKETYFLEGYDVTAGCVKRIGKPEKKHAALLKALKEMGAVPFIRTNIPHTCMAFDSVNPIYGTTRNPHNPERSCGGSSGGEGVSVATRSSLLGFGSDIGGSVRIPAAWNGCYSLKPTAGRLSDRGMYGVDFNERIVTVTFGPFAQDVKSLIAVMKGFSSSTTLNKDLYVPPVPFNNEELTSTRKLKIGYFYEIEAVRSSQSAKRALDLSIEALKEAGHELVEWNLPEASSVMPSLFCKNLFADGGKLFLDSIDGDRPSRHIIESVYLIRLPDWLKRLLYYLLIPVFPQYLREFVKGYIESSVRELWCLENEIKKYRYRIVQELEKNGIDAIVSPAMPLPAMRIGETQNATGVMCYLGLMNLLNFPSGIVPVTKVTSGDLETDKKRFPAKDMWHKAMKANLPGSKGLPMAVQVCSFPYHEERCLRVMSELESKIQYKL